MDQKILMPHYLDQSFIDRLQFILDFSVLHKPQYLCSNKGTPIKSRTA